MLYLIGLGLCSVDDITVKGLEIVRKADKVFLENYTSILSCDVSELEAFYKTKIILVDREMMEQGCDVILDAAERSIAAVLVVGDPLNATTHTDLLLRAAERNISYKIIHNASIINAIAVCGLQIYSYGETISIPFWTETWKPTSFYDKIINNRSNGLHTLCLLDIKVKEPNLELLAKGITKMEPPRFMSVSDAATQILEIILQKENEQFSLKKTDICICVARIGSDSQKIVTTTLEEASSLDIGGPLHSIVIPGKMHPLEEEAIKLFAAENN